MFLISSRGFKIDFKNRKRNYPNRKWNYFSHFQTSDKKISVTKCFSFVPRVSKLIFKTGNGIFQTGNGIISPTSRHLIKKLLLQNVSNLFERVQNQFLKQEMELSKQEMKLFLPLPSLWSKNFFYKIFLICSKGLYFHIFSPIFAYIHLYYPIFTYFYLFSP